MRLKPCQHQSALHGIDVFHFATHKKYHENTMSEFVANRLKNILIKRWLPFLLA
jgi:hypothetical protein